MGSRPRFPRSVVLSLAVGAAAAVGLLGVGRASANPVPPRLDLVVDSGADAIDAHPGDGVCDDGAGRCTLRAAIEEHDRLATTATNTITLLVDVDLSIPPTGNDDVHSGDLDVVGKLSILGHGHTIDGHRLDRVIHQRVGKLNLNSVVVQGGLVPDGPHPVGGGVWAEAFLNVRHSVIWFNRVTADGGAGGGIYGGPRSTILVEASSLWRNAANWYFPTEARGGAIAADGGLTLVGSVVAANGAGVPGIGGSGHGGGLDVSGPATTITGSVIRDNWADADGGGIASRGPALSVTDTTLSGNDAVGWGRALYVSGSGPSVSDATVVRSTVTVPPSDPGPGPAVAVGYGASLTVRNSTMDGGSGSAVLAFGGPATLIADTVGAGTTSGLSALVAWSPGSILATGSILTSAGAVCDSPITSAGWNIATDATCGLGQTGDHQSINPYLGALGNNGGPTATRLPASISPAVDAVPIGTPDLCDLPTVVDQRGLPRPEGSACDIGSVEGHAAPAPPIALVVDSAEDVRDAVAGDGMCDDGSGACTLRAAIDEANQWPAAVTIDIASGIDPGRSLSSNAAYDDNSGGDLDSYGFVTIHGNGASIDAGGLDRVLDVRAGSLSLDHVTLTGGDAQGGSDFDGRGGGIRSFGDLTMADVTVRGNRMGSPEISGGGGVAALGTLDMTRSTITGNFSEGGGGGVDAQGPSTTIVDSVISDNGSSSLDAPSHNLDTPGLLVGGGTARIVGTTIARNSSAQDRTDVASGGVLVTAASATIVNTTISDNYLGQGDPTDYLGGEHGTAGLTARGGSLDLVDVTIADNVGVGDAVELGVQGGPVTMGSSIVTGTAGPNGSPGPDCLGTVVSGGWNLVSDDTCALDGPGDRSSTDPLLGPLADNGGPTPTRLPLSGSPAVDAVPTGTVGLCDGSLTTDQRGVSRPQGTACDIGAVEVTGPP